MAFNATNHVTNSTHPNLSSACSIMGTFAWQQQYLTPKTFIMFVVTASVEALISRITTSLNALVILAVKRKRYLRKKKHCVLLACLAGTDLLVGAVVLPLVITSHVLRVLTVGPICLIDQIRMVLLHIACGASLFHLVIISGERYIAIKHALRYGTLVTTRRLTTAVAAAWAVPVSILSLFLAFSDLVVLVIADVFILNSIIAVSFSQVVVLAEGHRHRRHIRAHQVSESIARERLKKDKAARTMTMIVGALCLCFLPLIVFDIVAYVENLPKRVLACAYHVLEMLIFSNSLINPIIYSVRTQEFRRAFRELFNFEVSQINAEFEMNVVGRSRRQRKDNEACTDSSPGQTLRPLVVPWTLKIQHMNRKHAEQILSRNCRRRPDPTSPRGSHSRSLDLSKDSSHQQRIRRTNSSNGP